MRFEIPSFADGAPIPDRFAFGVPGDDEPITLGPNENPHVVWGELPEGTLSLALICHDPDVPSVPDDVNKPDRTLAADLPRPTYYHWVLVDIPPALGEIAAGADSRGVTPRGKPLGPTPHGVRGRNDYTAWFSGDPEMEGEYGGYDGPCPPFNDLRLHHYHFTLYALDVASLGLTGSFGGAEALAAIEGHVLGKGSWMGTYTLNPSMR